MFIFLVVIFSNIEMDRKIGKNERLFESLASIKNKKFRYFGSRYDINSGNTTCCNTCVPNSNVSEISNGSLKNIFDINNIYLLNGDHLQSWKYVRFYFYLDQIIKDEMVGFNRKKNSGNIVYRIFNGVVYFCLTIILRFLILVVYYLIQFPISRLIIHSGQINRLKICSNSGFPIIYIPTYRTEMDYILLSMAFFFCGIPKPVILRHRKGNTFRWIEQIFGFKSVVYDDLLSLERNLNDALSTGSSIIFHLEDQPLQDSKLSVVNGDIIHFIITFYKAGSIDDALIAPININYDILPVEDFCGNVLSQRSSLQKTIQSSVRSIYKIFTRKCGMCRVTFSQPYSLSEFLRNSRLYKESNSELTVFPLYSSEISSYEKSLSINLINHIIYDKFNSEVVMATDIVCFILLYETVAIFGDIVEKFDDYCDILENTHQLGFTGLADDIVAYAIELLQLHLKLDTVEISSSANTVNSAIKFDLDLIMDDRCKVFLNLEADGVILECFYYSNVLMNHLIPEMIVIYAVHNICMGKKKSLVTTASHSEVVNYAAKLFCILQYEFSFCPPCQQITEKINQIISKLHQERMLIVHQESSTEEEQWARRYAHHVFESDYDSFDSSNDYDDINVQNHELYNILLNTNTFTQSSEQQYSVNSEDWYKKRLDLCSLVMWTFVSQYLITTKALRMLISNTMLKSEYVDKMSADLKNFYNTHFVQNAGIEVVLSAAEKSLMLFSKLDILMFLEDNSENYVYLDKQCDSHEFCDQLISAVESVSICK